jgi:hypothetical protein
MSAPTVNPGDLRTYPRVPLEVPLAVIAQWNGATKIASGKCTDVSEGGMGASVPLSLLKGQSVSLEFSVPATSQFLKMRAILRYQDDHRCGFEFITPSSQQREQFRRLSDLLVSPESVQPLPSSTVEAAPRRPRILSVAYQYAVLDYRNAILQQSGFTVSAAGTLEDAERFLASSTFEAAVLGHGIPRGDRVELAGLIRFKKIPLIVLHKHDSDFDITADVHMNSSGGPQQLASRLHQLFEDLRSAEERKSWN